ncbi:MAG TPA: SDR family NAD(P)-dependent oxidoreductase [Burkholderiales bacterium]|nr:SDR family NAD(P)-dependent oxidoreductase [Burkholderiales bacterium]
MQSLPAGYKAIVLGATGAIGGAFVKALTDTPECDSVIGLSRHGEPPLDITNEESVADHAQALKPLAPFHLIVDATGALHMDGVGPEKRIDDIQAERLMRAFMVNAIGPALVMKHFTPLLPMHSRCVFAKLSARVGSISDNRKGGWYGYRASKAALNMLMRTAAIEVARKRPEALMVALQPGTVRSNLTKPFVAGDDAADPDTAVAMLLRAIDGLTASREALFIDYNGETVPW